MLQKTSPTLAGRLRRLLRPLMFLVVTAVAFILVRTIVDGWDEIAVNYQRLDYGYLALSFLLGQLNVASLMMLWWALLKKVTGGKGLSMAAAARIFASAWLGRYMPGRLWTAAGKVYLGNQLGVDIRSLSISVFFELTLSITAQATVALILLIVVFEGSEIVGQNEIYLAASILVAIMLAIHPGIFWRLVNWLLHRMGRPLVDAANVLSYRSILLFYMLYIGQVFIMGSSLLAFARALVPLNGQSGLFVLASFIAANLVGRIAFIAPVGIGFREGALTGLMQFKLPLAVASLITVLSRVWLIVIDLTFVALVFLLGRIGGTRVNGGGRDKWHTG
jgi:uncharacterized membrane protein YbhN (UPF0104 family)